MCHSEPVRACRQRRLLRQLSQRVAIAEHDPPQLDRGQLFQIQAGHGRRRNFRGTLSSLSPSSNRTSHAPFPCTLRTTPRNHLAARKGTDLLRHVLGLDVLADGV